MHSRAVVAEVLHLRKTGLGARRIAGRTDLPVSTVRDWLAGELPSHSRAARTDVCTQCGHASHGYARFGPSYVYLLGLYLGDGCISRHPRDVYRLRIFLDLRYPGIIDSAVGAIRETVPANKVSCRGRPSNYTDSPDYTHVEVSAFSKSWPCLLPQHGPGRKHHRVIALELWQDALIAKSPEQLIRGLIHSDGCRFVNTGRGNWRSPRYSFSNVSADIRGIFCAACERLGVHWTTAAPHTIYVSRKADVALLDEFIGPKA